MAAHAAYWERVWRTIDVRIEGDAENEQGIRYCIFQLHQTYHGVDPSLNVSAKGLTGESYWGATWWDTETYCLPFYIFNNPQAARNLLGYRHATLNGGAQRARQLDCRGARYPMATIDGSEIVGVWQHGDLEIHVSAAVAYGIWHYAHVTGDKEFLYGRGVEMLLEIARYYASRGQYSPATGEFGFWFVMGADEFHMGVHNNTYTNVMAKKCFQWALETAAEMRKQAPEQLRRVFKKIKLREAELRDWRRKARDMRVLQDPRTGLIEQHDGYFDMPRLPLAKVPPTDFPLYHHWAYVRIFRWDMTKQPDVLLLPFFFSREYSEKAKRVNFEYYEPRCSHESSLSPGIHSILAAELGIAREGLRVFAPRRAARSGRLQPQHPRRLAHDLDGRGVAAAGLWFRRAAQRRPPARLSAVAAAKVEILQLPHPPPRQRARPDGGQEERDFPDSRRARPGDRGLRQAAQRRPRRPEPAAAGEPARLEREKRGVRI